MEDQIEYISSSLALQIKPNDILKRIELQVMIEDIMHSVREKDVLDTEDLVDLSLLGVPFISFLMKYKNISDDEARALISYGYVTYYDFMLILRCGVE
ncbi:hypothetical protein GGR21_002453 [Dysgonomonas hofstadii]|uniref:Uncharacterized protein n=1 Tax=Dysgonomonas hofstadii TaxID=637886 RepID=A0A840CKG2_9BACT|nr:hypothetical protein [Dysgonomonas hofstadii]MBB4036547.1 hypothetical protein [Dysgonomonas hofstadii]